ncbi:thiol-disulfide oxidoreductase DCC family protein [Curvivirga sp.]|uniref:thiol-disulfide oxidoreductase DCC family protein n=1 Tax=Curvivirga sp. TaxID=2856848 RepID=UPI003B5CAEAA
MIKIFYDGGCGLCSKEIKYYQRIAPEDRFEWYNISESQNELSEFNISEIDALKQLHVIDDEGILYVGVDAFLVIWRHLKYWKTLALITSLWPVKIILKILYGKFAASRFVKLYGA